MIEQKEKAIFPQCGKMSNSRTPLPPIPCETVYSGPAMSEGQMLSSFLIKEKSALKDAGKAKRTGMSGPKILGIRA
jgi:hypothetical protein